MVGKNTTTARQRIYHDRFKFNARGSPTRQELVIRPPTNIFQVDVQDIFVVEGGKP
jgi:hypothetical protein